MPYTQTEWKNRHQSRSDMSVFLTHLTRSVFDKDGNIAVPAVDILIKILTEEKLIGSNNAGFISGHEKAVCFQDVPLYGVSQNVRHEELNKTKLGNKVRYQGYGIALPKPYVFKRGGRPVIYEQKSLGIINYPDDLWRVVTYDLSDKNNIIDWTHEREWRVKGDFTFDIKSAYVILPNQKIYKEFVKKVPKQILEDIRGITILNSILY
ncbi:hypothetical protein [Domibacillus tundrae]|uniref:hypothetical protein n=1 Tax=Domibacillus tundrae TaxID=1587527 RepID=UPI000617E081|nr:hypothetical protein [Domibacillus tundrae]